MKLRKWFEDWHLTKVSIKAGIANLEWAPADADKAAAWDMYIELLTRVTTQPLSDDDGVEQTALESVHKLFPLTREILKTHGRDCEGFARVAITILNQVIRPFTASWHSRAQGFGSPEVRSRFRRELAELQDDLRNYSGMLAEIAGVEDLTSPTSGQE